jgi:hypothetical protein
VADASAAVEPSSAASVAAAALTELGYS